MTMVVIMPALNEAEGVPAALAGRPADLRVLVVDNGSEDETAKVARSWDAEVIVEPRRGFGHACLAGARASPAGSTLVFVDADGTFAWDDIVAVGQLVDRGATDFAVSWRRRDLREPRSMPWHVAVGNRLLAFVLTHVAGVRLHDLGPLRSIRREMLLELGLVERTYGWPLEMVILAAQRGLTIEEYPVRYRVRAGQSKVTGRPLPTVAAAARMLVVIAQNIRSR